MNKRDINIWGIWIVFLSFLSQGCEKELDIKYNEIAPIPVIEGELTQNGANVKIMLTTPMNEPMDTRPLTDANVTLTDQTTGICEILYVDETGIFQSATFGVTGHTYQLTVERAGELYKSKCEMKAPTEIISLEFNWIKMPYDHVAVLQVNFTDNPAINGECYWVRLYRNGVAYMWNLVTDLYSHQGIINDVFMTSRMDLDEEDEATALRDGDVVSVVVTPVSRDMYDYLEAVSSDSNGPSMYEGDFCLGYFLASPVARDEVTFHPDLIPYM